MTVFIGLNLAEHQTIMEFARKGRVTGADSMEHAPALFQAEEPFIWVDPDFPIAVRVSIGNSSGTVYFTRERLGKLLNSLS